MPRLNYDEIAHLYDDPLRDHDVDSHLLTFMGDQETCGCPFGQF